MGLLTDDPDELAKLTADPSPLNPIPTQMYDKPAGPAGNVVDFGASAPLLERLGTALPMATMGFGAPTFLGRMGLNAAVGAGSEALKGSSPEEALKTGGLMAAIGGGAEKVGQGLRYIGSAIPKKAFDAAQESKIGDWLKQRVPWWNDLTVSEMATSSKAKEALQNGYADAITAAREQIPEGAKASIPIDVANALKLKGEGGMDTRFLSPKVMQMLEQAGKVGADTADTVSVNARELLDKLPGSAGQIRAQILRGLDPVAGDVIPEAREAFKVGRGWQELANRGGIGKEGVFNAETAQKALRTPAKDQSLAQKALQPRGMGELEQIVQGPLKEPITSVTPNSLAWHLGLGGAGLLGGLGLHGMHGMAGAAAGLIPRPTFYRNVPPMVPRAGPLAQQGLRAVMPGFLGNMRSSSQED